MNRRAGFSLLELLVALALLAIIGAGLASAMRLGTETYSRAQSLGRGDSGAARAQLRRLMERATPPNLLTPFPKEFDGTGQSLTFVTLAPIGIARDAAGLKVSVSRENLALIATIEPFDDEGAVLRRYTAPLASGVTSVALSYYSEGEWKEEWSNSATLPELVRISAEGEDVFWPEFTVELVHSD